MNWIHINDQKPEYQQDVFYFFEVLGVYKGKYRKYNYHEDLDDVEPCWGDVFYGKKGFLTDDATHWMPAPTDDEWNGIFPDVPDGYVKVYDTFFNGYAKKDETVLVRKDEYDSLRDELNYYRCGHLGGLVCQDGCPCHIYWNEESDGYECGGCGKVYPTDDCENNPEKYRKSSFIINKDEIDLNKEG